MEDLRSSPLKHCNRLPFEAIVNSCADTIWVPAGYRTTPFIPWDIPISSSYPGFFDDVNDSVQDQVEQIGIYYDDMRFFPVDTQFGFGGGYIGSHGLLMLNHEYIDTPLLHTNGPAMVGGKRTVADEVHKGISAHGVFVVEIRHNVRDGWNAIPSQRSRRIAATTPIRVIGPARDRELLRACHSPDGTRTYDTRNNHSDGFTP